jgi:leader peptidase (prepilin peptidase)/N-methyltransferase
MIYFYGVFVFLAGLTIGSFINVCIYRLPRHISIVRPRSRCPSCGAQIKAWHNIPLISFLLLRGRCAYCGARISWRYPIVELLTGLLFLLAYVDLWLDKANFIGFIIGLYLSSVFLIIFFIDLEHRIIPDSLTISGMIIGFGTSFLPGSALPWYLSLIGLLAGGLIFLAVAEIGDRIFKK